ncbi:hypothetical protein GCM10010274_35620 [Streptomyces lavendofoliae]|uniref:Uncharacterized protein n=1 Tax=Streptomyces lavendofoliae TaxID=67314 RepID=A0A918M4X0_9ACTN|nr:hypothetical protein GCM10010274_35620 [Streptomyces lavendofoliae]
MTPSSTTCRPSPRSIPVTYTLRATQALLSKVKVKSEVKVNVEVESVPEVKSGAVRGGPGPDPRRSPGLRVGRRSG